MTPKQRRALEFIGGFVETTGVSPSYEEIAEGIGIPRSSKSRVFAIVTSLIERGYLTREGGAGLPRALRPTTAGRAVIPQVSLAGIPTSALYAELERRRHG